MSLYYCWVTKMANAVVLWVLVYFCVTSVNTKVCVFIFFEFIIIEGFNSLLQVFIKLEINQYSFRGIV